MLARCLEKEDHPIQVGILYPGAVYSDIYNSAVSQSPKTFPDQPAFQEFIDNNKHDIRISVIGKKAWAFKSARNFFTHFF